MAMTGEELRKVANLYYDQLPERQQRKALRFFEQLDADGDGVLTLPELLASRKLRSFGSDAIQRIFWGLDGDGKGQLDDGDCLALYYLFLFSRRRCAGCERSIPQGLGYTCSLCAASGSSGEAFELCLDCFAEGEFHHQHEGPHFLHDFVFFNALRQWRPPPSPPPPAPAPAPVVQEASMEQCTVCGDFHQRSAGGFMCDRHMTNKKGTEEFVCEWCFSYFCGVCGRTFRDDTARAELGKWMQKFSCASCHKLSRGGGQDQYDAILRQLKRRLRDSELRSNCRTCDIKCRNGTLFWRIDAAAGGSAFPGAAAAAHVARCPPPSMAPPQVAPPSLPHPAHVQYYNANSSPRAQQSQRRPRPAASSSAFGNIVGGLRVANQVVHLVNGLTQLGAGPIGDGIAGMVGDTGIGDVVGTVSDLASNN